MENIIKRAEILGQMKSLNEVLIDMIVSGNKYLAYKYENTLSVLKKEYEQLEKETKWNVHTYQHFVLNTTEKIDVCN